MTEVGFYHLVATPLERALPALLEKVLESGARAVVLAPGRARLEAIDSGLWVYRQDSFLPHGTAAAGEPADQPIYLTTVEDNPNGASVLVLLDGADPGFVAGFARCLDIFEGADPGALEAARARWKARKEAGFSVTYWKQAADGRWEKGS